MGSRRFVVLVAVAAAALVAVSTVAAHTGAPFRRPNAVAWEIKRIENRWNDADVYAVVCEGAGPGRQGRYQHFWCGIAYRGREDAFRLCFVHLTGWTYGDYKLVRCSWEPYTD